MSTISYLMLPLTSMLIAQIKQHVFSLFSVLFRSPEKEEIIKDMAEQSAVLKKICDPKNFVAIDARPMILCASSTCRQ